MDDRGSELESSAPSAHDARARELGVSNEALAAAEAIELEPRNGAASDALRVMQWNILADGLANDGFLVRDVLDPASEAVSVEETLSKMDEARGGDMSQLKRQLGTVRAAKNLTAVVDWTRRWEKIKEVIEAAQPDVIALQELDHFADAARDLKALGYECAMPNGQYGPVHAAGLAKGDVAAYVSHLERRAVAFAPNVSSTCRKQALKEHPYSPADDDGSAIFWRTSSMECESITFLPFGEASRVHGVVRVTLRRRSDERSFNVMSAHLKSGDKPEHEAERIHELDSRLSETRPSVLGWFEESAENEPTIFCLDANSSPKRTEERTVWKVLRSVVGVSSVWDFAYDPDGTALGSPLPVSTNKMRGPLSSQPAKIGGHAYQLIDHVFYSEPLTLKRHVCAPLHHENGKADARSQLLPSLGIPSDHMPVIVDFDLPPKGGAASAAASADESKEASRTERTRIARPWIIALLLAALVAWAIQYASGANTIFDVMLSSQPQLDRVQTSGASRTPRTKRMPSRR